MAIKASELKEFLLKLHTHKKGIYESLVNDKEANLSMYLKDKYRPLKNLNETFVAGSESLVAGDDDSSSDYTLQISQSQEQEIRQEMQDTIKLFGNDW